jgi:hypothetical protein
MTAIDQDDSATWIQLRDRLREIREWAEKDAGGEYAGGEVLAILDRPRETLDGPEVTP